MTKKNTSTSLAQQRELLNLKAENIRLKALADQLKNRKNGAKPINFWPFFTLLDMLPLSSLALKLSSKPKLWRNKLLLSGTLLSLIFLIQKMKSNGN